MPRINFAEVEDMESTSFSPIPDGSYPCRVADVKDGHQTKSGDEMWRLEFEIISGDFKGRRLFDNMIFSQKAASRVKLICSRLGIDTSGEVDLQPRLLRGREVWITTYQEQYEGKTQNRIPFDGYESMEATKQEATQAEPAAVAGEDVPF